MYLDQDKITSGILCHDYIRNELVFLRWLFQFAQTEKIPLTILGKLDEEHDAEKAYYDDLSNKISFNYIKNYPGRNTYKIIDQVELVVSLDSSLGYEALSRGKKVAIFPGIRGDSYPLNTRNFCWPSNQVKNTGHFWTNSVNENQWNTVLQYVVSATSEQWNNDCDRYINQAIAVDRNNSQFCTLLEKMDLSK